MLKLVYKLVLKPERRATQRVSTTAYVTISSATVRAPMAVRNARRKWSFHQGRHTCTWQSSRSALSWWVCSALQDCSFSSKKHFKINQKKGSRTNQELLEVIDRVRKRRLPSLATLQDTERQNKRLALASIPVFYQLIRISFP